MSRKNRTTDAIEIMRRMLFNTPQREAEYQQTAREMALGMKIRRIREEMGLTQKELAKKIGTQPSAISRIEDADYDRHSLSLLGRVADALDMWLLIDFAPKHPKRRAKQRKRSA